MATLQDSQPLTMSEMLASLDPDLIRHYARMRWARHKMDAAGFLAAYEDFCAVADATHKALTIETWAPSADSQSGSVLAAELPELPPSLVAMHQAGVLRTLHEDKRDNG